MTAKKMTVKARKALKKRLKEALSINLDDFDPILERMHGKPIENKVTLLESAFDDYIHYERNTVVGTYVNQLTRIMFYAAVLVEHLLTAGGVQSTPTVTGPAISAEPTPIVPVTPIPIEGLNSAH